MTRLLFVAAALSALLLHAGILYLRDGRTVRGAFISGNSREIRFLADGGRAQRYLISAVDHLTFGNDSQDGLRTRTLESVVPAGTPITVRLIDSIDASETDVGRTWRASLDGPVIVNGRTAVPRGADARVQVVREDQSGTGSGREEIALVLSEIVAAGRPVPVPETRHAETAASSPSQEKMSGGTAGDASGAGAGAIHAICGQRIQIPAGTRLRFALGQPLRL